MFRNLWNKIKKENSKTQDRGADFVIISNNCWGAEIYKEFGYQFNTPFIGLFLYCEDYINLLENFKDIKWYALTFVDKSRWINHQIDYPVGLLNGNIEIHFLHYKSENEALEKWTRRTQRMLNIPFERFFFKIDDRDNADGLLIARFHNLPYENLVSFTLKKYPYQNNIQIRETEDNKQVPDGLKLYRISKKYFNPLKWIKK